MTSLEALERDWLHIPDPAQCCPDCDEPMEQTDSYGYFWKCPECGYTINGEPILED